MNYIYEKEKKLDQVLEKLSLINPQNLNSKETISSLSHQKNQLEIEKKELEIKYIELEENYKKLKSKIDELNFNNEVEKKKELEFEDKIDELNQETDNLIDELDKWQT